MNDRAHIRSAIRREESTVCGESLGLQFFLEDVLLRQFIFEENVERLVGDRRKTRRRGTMRYRSNRRARVEDHIGVIRAGRILQQTRKEALVSESQPVTACAARWFGTDLVELVSECLRAIRSVRPYGRVDLPSLLVDDAILLLNLSHRDSVMFDPLRVGEAVRHVRRTDQLILPARMAASVGNEIGGIGEG